MLFEDVAAYYEKLEGISSRLGMIDVLTDMLKEAGAKEIKKLIYMTQGVLAPSFEGVQVGIAERLAEEAISMASGHSAEEVHKSFKQTGDLGETAALMIANGKLRRMNKKKFDVAEVFDSVAKIATTSGSGSQEIKIRTLSELLASSSPREAKYIVRFVLGTLRLGVGDATILEALSKAVTGNREFKPELEKAYNICTDLGRVGEVLFEQGVDGIKRFKVSVFSPIRPALAERLPTSVQILEKMNGKCAVESKYDGMRVQIHMSKKLKKVEIFSRRLERTTDMFPDIAKAALVELKADEVILDGEAISYNESTGEFRPFQETVQRKRKHGIEEMAEELPIHVFAFDMMYIDGEDYLNKPYEERRKRLEGIVAKEGLIKLADRIMATKPSEIDNYFNAVIERGLEGIVAKDLNAHYIAGARKFSWIKMKRSYKGEMSDSVDLVIVGYYLGRGSRAEFKFGGLLCATYNKKRDMFETVTKLGTGFSEAQMEQLRSMLEKIRTKSKPARVDSLVEPDFWVEPKYVVTIKADEITKSPMHTCGMEKQPDGTVSGYALRFPRLVSDGVRADKSVEEATTTQEIIEMFKNQRQAKVEDK
ncbi:MAG: ATP-dependent DNA ligase [Candidatus Micrarchaeia archaeon]